MGRSSWLGWIGWTVWVVWLASACGGDDPPSPAAQAVPGDPTDGVAPAPTPVAPVTPVAPTPPRTPPSPVAGPARPPTTPVPDDAGTPTGDAMMSHPDAGPAVTPASPDAGGPRTYSDDPSTFGGPPRCQGYAFCESFEGGVDSVPSGWATWRQAAQTMGVVMGTAMRGQGSLHITVPAGGFARAWFGRDDLGDLGRRLYGRVFMRIAGPGAPQFVHWDAVSGTGPYGGHGNEVRLASTGTGVGSGLGNWSWIYNVQPYGNGAGNEFGTEGPRSGKPVVDAWMCLEWFFDADAQEARFWMDGRELDYLHIDEERSEIPVFEQMFVGFAKYQDTAAFEVWVDEVVFDAERIGCNH